VNFATAKYTNNIICGKVFLFYRTLSRVMGSDDGTIGVVRAHI